jgi:hypothetical protein
VPGCNSADESALARRARAILATWADMADLVRLGAYRAGTDPIVDEAVALAPRIEALLRQEKFEHSSLAASFADLSAMLAPAGPGTINTVTINTGAINTGVINTGTINPAAAQLVPIRAAPSRAVPTRAVPTRPAPT